MGIALGSSQIHLKLSHSLTLVWRNLKRLIHRSHMWFAKETWHTLYGNNTSVAGRNSVVPIQQHTNEAAQHCSALPMAWIMHTATDAHGQAWVLRTAPHMLFNNLPTFHFVSNVIDFYSPLLNLFPGLLFSCHLHATQDNVFQVGVNGSVLHIHHLEKNTKILFLCLLLWQEHRGRFPEKHEQQIFTSIFVSGRPTWDLIWVMLSVKTYFLVILSENWLNKCRWKKTNSHIQFWCSRLVLWMQWQLLPQFSQSPEQQLPSNNNGYWPQ